MHPERTSCSRVSELGSGRHLIGRRKARSQSEVRRVLTAGGIHWGPISTCTHNIGSVAGVLTLAHSHVTLTGYRFESLSLALFIDSRQQHAFASQQVTLSG